METYKRKHTFEQRKNESTKVMSRHVLSVPIIVEPQNERIVRIDKIKFLVPKDLMFSQFIFVIRKRLNINSSQSIFVFADNVLPQQSESIQALYKRYRDEDGFLYLKYSFENTFG
tara:strand:+ start:683 stop:1027 length:345 start_codon:yes stop_codon:yes gene_type:complete